MIVVGKLYILYVECVWTSVEFIYCVGLYCVIDCVVLDYVVLEYIVLYRTRVEFIYCVIDCVVLDYVVLEYIVLKLCCIGLYCV